MGTSVCSFLPGLTGLCVCGHGSVVQRLTSPVTLLISTAQRHHFERPKSSKKFSPTVFREGGI